ncbi:MAG: hypothetical protein WCP92_02045 [bacterium]
MLLLVPTVREGTFGIENDIMWSLKEFDFKVFGYLNVESVMSSILKERALAGVPFYDIDMDMYDPNTYPDTMESSFKNRWDYAVMRQTYRYFDQLLIKNFTSPMPTAFVVSCEWNNNTHDALQIYPLDDENICIEGQDKLAIQFSSYTDYSEKMIEDLIVQIGKCKKLPKNYQSFKPVKEEEKVIPGEHLIKESNPFFLLKDGNIYCGMDWINPNILMKGNWRLFADEMIHPIGCEDCNPGYKMKIRLPSMALKIFKHSLHKDYAKNFGNDCYSVYIQLLNIINSQWKKIQKEMNGVERIVFETKYDDSRNGKGRYMVVEYLDKDWKGQNVQEIIFTEDSDYIVQDKEVIANAL